MPLPLTVSCFSKVQIGFTFLVPADLGSPDKGPLNRCVCVHSAAELLIAWSDTGLLPILVESPWIFQARESGLGPWKPRTSFVSIFQCCVLQCKGCLLKHFGHGLQLTVSCVHLHKRYFRCCIISFLRLCVVMPPTLVGTWNSAIRLSVNPSIPWRSCLGYRHAGCLQLRHHQPPELRIHPRRGIDPPRFSDRSVIGGGISSGRYLVV